MRGGLEETLARLARREEALRRRGTDPVGDTRELPDDPGGAPSARPVDPSGRWGGQHRADAPGPNPVEEVAEAVRRVVERHPHLAVALRVEYDGRAYPLRVARSGDSVTVSAEPGLAPPPAWPLSARTVPDRSAGPEALNPDPAARLAELIRRDPSLLTDLGPSR